MRTACSTTSNISFAVMLAFVFVVDDERTKGTHLHVCGRWNLRRAIAITRTALAHRNHGEMASRRKSLPRVNLLLEQLAVCVCSACIAGGPSNSGMFYVLQYIRRCGAQSNDDSMVLWRVSVCSRRHVKRYDVVTVTPVPNFFFLFISFRIVV